MKLLTKCVGYITPEGVKDIRLTILSSGKQRGKTLIITDSEQTFTSLSHFSHFRTFCKNNPKQLFCVLADIYVHAQKCNKIIILSLYITIIIIYHIIVNNRRPELKACEKLFCVTSNKEEKEQ